MPHRFRYARVLSLMAALAVLYTVEDCIFPELFGAVPSLLIPFTVAVGICEGPYMGAGFGVAAGLLMDHAASAFGFSALLLLVIGTATGLVITYFRRTAVSALVFTAVSAAVFFVIKWFFLHYLWYGFGRLEIAGLQTLYAALLAIPVYLLTQLLSKRFGSLQNA